MKGTVRARVNDIVLHYELTGRGPLVTLVHGAGGTSDDWREQVPVFAQRHRVLTFDLRGHGQSDRPEDGYTLDALADDLAALLDHVDGSWTYLVGDSLGGAIAATFAARVPERVPALVLVSSTGAPPTPPPSEQLLLARGILYHEQGRHEEAVRFLRQAAANNAFSAGFIQRHPEVFERYLQVRVDHTTSYARLVRSLFRNPATIDAARVRCPTLLVVGEHDAWLPEATARTAARAFPNAVLVTLPAGHAVPLERPDLFNSLVLDFLDAVEAGRPFTPPF
ncbi:MAG TPA: alpha/beta hydrolase [Chloroflexota bacterium]